MQYGFEALRCIGGPYHNKVVTVPRGTPYYEVAKTRRLDSYVTDAALISPLQLTEMRIVYTRRHVAGIAFFMVQGKSERDYLQNIFGAEPTEKKKRQRINRKRSIEREVQKRLYAVQSGRRWP